MFTKLINFFGFKTAKQKRVTAALKRQREIAEAASRCIGIERHNETVAKQFANSEAIRKHFDKPSLSRTNPVRVQSRNSNALDPRIYPRYDDSGSSSCYSSDSSSSSSSSSSSCGGCD